MITANGITKQFANTVAIDNLSFKVNQGEIYGIVGPDGAGKSTLLRLMAGLLVPNSGSVTINDWDVQINPFLIKENIAYMPQRFGLYEDLTVEENIYFFGRLFGLSNKKIKQNSERLYEFSQLAPFKKRLAGQLSGGMKQKLGLACCLIHQPLVLLLDEPTNGVDPVSRREFWKILYELLSDNVTIVVSTAYLDEAERCSRVALLNHGSFLISGTPQEIKKSIPKKLIGITCANPNSAERLLENNPAYKRYIRTGNSLRVYVDNINETKRDLVKYFKKEKEEILSIKEIAPSLEDCFMELLLTEGNV